MNHNWRILLAALIAAMLTLLSSANVLAANDISIFVDGVKVSSDVPPQIINDRTMVPVRAVTEALGCPVEWFGADRRVEVYGFGGDGEPFIIMYIDNPLVTVNRYNGMTGETDTDKITIDAPPVIINGRTFVPLRFIAETFGLTVDWDASSRMVSLSWSSNLPYAADRVEMLDPELIELLLSGVPDAYTMVNVYGMDILITGETTYIPGSGECQDIWIGTDHEDKFTREVHYTIGADGNIYMYDPLNDEWSSANVN